jgi:surface carbohydrate biosynthesis protein
MPFGMSFTRLKWFFAFVFGSRWEWLPLNRSEVVIFDATNADILLPYLTPYSIRILAIRGESINIWCLIRAVFTSTFWTGALIQAYADSFIEISSPKIVITLIDNNPDFYSISKRFPSVTTIFLQNGTRGEGGDVFGQLIPSEQYHVDWMLVHNNVVGKHYRNYVSGNIVPLGSLKNNSTPISPEKEKKGVLFVSQFHAKPPSNAPLWVEADGTPVHWDQFFRFDKLTIGFLGKWCRDNQKLLLVCGRESNEWDIERDFFASELKDCPWEFIPRSSSNNTYMLIDSAEIVVTIDSTLGYEAIGRGKKTAVVSCRVIDCMNSSRKLEWPFGWPADFPENGLFWTNALSLQELKRVMDYLSQVSDTDWERVRQQYMEALMSFDPGNSILEALLNQIMAEPTTPAPFDYSGDSPSEQVRSNFN